MDQTVSAMQNHWEAKQLRDADHWRDEIRGLQDESDAVILKYKKMVEKGAQRACESSKLRTELEFLRHDKIARDKEEKALTRMEVEPRKRGADGDGPRCTPKKSSEKALKVPN